MTPPLASVRFADGWNPSPSNVSVPLNVARFGMATTDSRRTVSEPPVHETRTGNETLVYGVDVKFVFATETSAGNERDLSVEKTKDEPFDLIVWSALRLIVPPVSSVTSKFCP